MNHRSPATACCVPGFSLYLFSFFHLGPLAIRGLQARPRHGGQEARRADADGAMDGGGGEHEKGRGIQDEEASGGVGFASGLFEEEFTGVSL